MDTVSDKVENNSHTERSQNVCFTRYGRQSRFFRNDSSRTLINTSELNKKMLDSRLDSKEIRLLLFNVFWSVNVKKFI